MSIIDYTNPEIFAYPKPPKTERKQRKPIKGKKHKQTKKTDIPTTVKMQVWERDNHRCIFCKKLVPWNNANAHFVKRSAGGLGIVQNTFTACDPCHGEQDNGHNSIAMTDYAREYLKLIYGQGWNEKLLIYRKYNY